ncbi:ABC transporter ATP-binding protein [Melittangium boletus]|uniref:O-antigen ABC exporter, ATP-binding protein n=1 Tax=Melittangium boletus DSM 14713 TaxID=1294270 RepID=A0A250IRX2_9BACT|nr:ABC transporter ATP-binding protein [Melittangium boletus]ATB34484.1 O-antigen ABC exporter, ATP-binding protein [Melittangium boletus DSM 14713]
MTVADNANAIVIRDVVKSFRKSTIRREYTTFKSELVRWIRGQRQAGEVRLIEALRGINLTIPRGRTVGILGRNGSGKSTLLKLITGIYSPTTGSIEVNGRISALLDLGAGFHPDFSGRENILINGIILGMTRAEVFARMDEIIAFSELGDFIDEPVRTYSSGMYMRLAFSVATYVDPDILIIDEILAVGDQHFAKKSLAKMTEFKERGKTIVLVTHDLGTVERWCDMAAWIDGGRIRRVGTPAEVADEYRQAIEIAEASAVTFIPPALALGDTGRLPDVPSVTGSGEAQPTTAPVTLLGVRLIDQAGAELRHLSPGQSAEVLIDYAACEGTGDAEFEVSLEHADGKLLYATSTRLDAVSLPERLPPQGRVRFILERLELLGGDYVLGVQVRTAGGEAPGPKTQCHFTVVSEHGEKGVFRPAHRWVVENSLPARALSSVS